MITAVGRFGENLILLVLWLTAATVDAVRRRCLRGLAAFERAADATPRLSRRWLKYLAPQHDLLSPEPAEALTLMVNREKEVHIQLWGGAITTPRLVEIEQIILGALHSVRQQIKERTAAGTP